MRKFLVAGIGVFLLSGAFVFNSDARSGYGNSCGCAVSQKVDPKKRYVSQGCCADRKRHIRAFSERIGPWKHRVRPSRRQRVYANCTTCNKAIDRRYLVRGDANRYGQYRRSNLSRAQKIAFQRAIFGYNNGGRNLNLVSREQSDRHVVRNNDYRLKSNYKVRKVTQNLVVPDNFTLSLPGDFTEQNGIYRSDKTSLAFRVINGGKCNSIAFNDCVKRLNRNLEKSSNLHGLYGLQSFLRWNHTTLPNETYYQTLTQSFDAVSRYGKNTYFTFSTLDPSTGNIIRIEAVANARERSIAAKQAFEIFETFRLKI